MIFRSGVCVPTNRMSKTSCLISRLALPPPPKLLFFGTGFKGAPRTSNASNRIETKRLVGTTKPLLASRTIVGIVPRN